MEYIAIGICIVIIIAVCAFLILKVKAKKDVQKNVLVAPKVSDGSNLITPNEKTTELSISLERLPVEHLPNESMLTEITDSKVLARIDQLVPGILQAGASVGNAVQESGQVLYQAIIPKGAQLAASRDMAGAYRGIYHGSDGINGHANLVEFDTSANVVANIVASAIGVTSMVVGQYYMTQINAELDEIHGEISKIADFQDTEYKSKVLALVEQVKAISVFQVDIIENDELRMSKISHLNALEQQCIELLGQANLTIEGFAKKQAIDYELYEKEIGSVQCWYIYQSVLLDVLYRISDLKYTLHFGCVSREQCNVLLLSYTKQVIETQVLLKEWHKSHIERFGIDTSEIRRNRTGWDGLIHKLPGLINDDYNYRSISESTAAMINNQTSECDNTYQSSLSSLFKEDVKLIAKDGKVYYLPEKITS